MTHLKPGDLAPRVETLTIDGGRVQVPSSSWILLSFLRYASCPMCNLRVRELNLASVELESRQITWIAVFHSPIGRLERHFGEEARRHIIADPGKDLYAKYGIQRSWLGMVFSMLVPSFYWRFVRATVLGYWGGAIDGSFHSMPADFLISPDGRIQVVHYGKHIGDHVALSAIRSTNDRVWPAREMHENH